jgi:hypothetical protein
MSQCCAADRLDQPRRERRSSANLLPGFMLPGRRDVVRQPAAHRFPESRVELRVDGLERG